MILHARIKMMFSLCYYRHMHCRYDESMFEHCFNKVKTNKQEERRNNFQTRSPATSTVLKMATDYGEEELSFVKQGLLITRVSRR